MARSSAHIPKQSTAAAFAQQDEGVGIVLILCVSWDTMKCVGARWTVGMVKSTALQTYTKSDQWPSEWVQQQLQAGYKITSIASSSIECVVVMTKYLNQTAASVHR